jgi:anti-anti-sigma factor
MLDISVVSTPQFEIVSEPAPGGVLRVCLAGDFDMNVDTALSDALVEAARLPGVTQVVVDLQRTVFLDSHGVAGLIAGFEAATHAGRPFTVVNAHGMIRRVLDITGLSDLLIDDESHAAG